MGGGSSKDTAKGCNFLLTNGGEIRNYWGWSKALQPMLPHVVRFNGRDPKVRHAYADLASAPEIACVSDGLDEALEALVTAIEETLDLAGMPRSLADCGVEHSMIPTMDRPVQSLPDQCRRLLNALRSGLVRVSEGSGGGPILK